MLILERYIMRAILRATLVVFALMLAVVLIISTLNELRQLGQGDYRFLKMIGYVILRAPLELYHYSPMMMLMSALLGLLFISQTYELTAMRALGLSKRRITASVLMSAFLIIGVLTMVGELTAPRLSKIALMQKQNAKHGSQSIVTPSGLWFHIGRDFLHVDQIINKHLLLGVTRYEFNEAQQLVTVYYAKKMVKATHSVWMMVDVLQTRLFHDQARSDRLKDLAWTVYLNTDLFNEIVEPEDMSLVKIVQFSQYLEKNGLRTSDYDYSFWQRILQPFVNLIMVLLAIPFMLNASAREGYGRTLFLGIVASVSFFLFDAILFQMGAVFQWPAWLAAALPLLILAALCCYLIIRKRANTP